MLLAEDVCVKDGMYKHLFRGECSHPTQHKSCPEPVGNYTSCNCIVYDTINWYIL